MAEAYMDESGRILLPEGIREALGLKPEQKLEVKARGKEIVISVASRGGRPINIEEVTEVVYPGDPERAKTLWSTKNHPY